jgi:hypothetical protein
MVLGNYLKLFSVTAIFVVMIFFFSCEEVRIINCDECYTDEPYDTYLEIKLDVIAPGVIVTIFTGNLEDNIKFASYKTYSKTSYYKVPLNKSYTVTAEYIISGVSYIAVNKVKPRVTFSEEQCTDPCYYVYDRSANLKLKNVDFNNNLK